MKNHRRKTLTKVEELKYIAYLRAWKLHLQSIEIEPGDTREKLSLPETSPFLLPDTLNIAKGELP